MEPSFFFYDLETTGIDSRQDRIIQFAGQRTSLELEPIGAPVNWIVKLSTEIIPHPGAVLVTGVLPQTGELEGITEAELAKRLMREVFTPGTIATGFNSIRFDDEFVRQLFWRTFYDPYAWGYAEGRSRWDLLDVMRMTRALRPAGITWPVDETGRPVNKLAMLTAANGLTHEHAHDALSDVTALIAVAGLVKATQPKMFSYLLALRHKQEVAKLINPHRPVPVVYSSGRYGHANHFTTVAVPIGPGKHSAVLMYDLRHDPATYAGKSPEELAAIRLMPSAERPAAGLPAWPVKELMLNRCPAVAPIEVYDTASQDRLGLTLETASDRLERLQHGSLITNLRAAANSLKDYPPNLDVDASLYDAFLPQEDRATAQTIAHADELKLSSLQPRFRDDRLPELFIRYKARNFPGSLTPAEADVWQRYRNDRLRADWAWFGPELAAASKTADAEGLVLLNNLASWAQARLKE